MESVLAIKIRTREIDEPAMEIARGRFLADLAQQRLAVAPSVLERHFHSARNYWFNMEPPKVFERWMP
jgi:hypothetical protein